MNIESKPQMISRQRCQLQDIHFFLAEPKPVENRRKIFRLKLILKRYLSPSQKRNIKKLINKIVPSFRHRKNNTVAEHRNSINQVFHPGDRVRVRSWEEIRETLDIWNECHGCSFMREMEKYCGTTQTVLKPVERFLDERDYKIKSVKGLVILEGLHCEGIEGYGRCDRNCSFFWRVEWLEKIP